MNPWPGSALPSLGSSRAGIFTIFRQLFGVQLGWFMERTMVITSQKVEIWGSNILCGYVSICIQFWLELTAPPSWPKSGCGGSIHGEAKAHLAAAICRTSCRISLFSTSSVSLSLMLHHVFWDRAGHPWPSDHPQDIESLPRPSAPLPAAPLLQWFGFQDPHGSPSKLRCAA